MSSETSNENDEQAAALYRRFRPGTLAGLIGQDVPQAALARALQESRVSHAYLFSGPRGCGKTSAARVLAKALNCETPDGVEPCNECTSCMAITNGTSPDVREVDAASNSGVDAVRDLIATVAFAAYGRRKVYIIDEVHQLSNAAASALLKTLEEPPPHVVFILATTHPDNVLATIKSRAQHLRFKLVPAAVMEAHLVDVAARAGIEVTAEQLLLAVNRGSGSVRDALSALDTITLADEAPTGGPLRLLQALVAGDMLEMFIAIAQAAGEGLEARALAELSMAQFRDMFLIQMGAASEVSTADLGGRDELAAKAGPRLTVRLIEALAEAISNMRGDADARVNLEVSLCRVLKAGK